MQNNSTKRKQTQEQVQRDKRNLLQRATKDNYKDSHNNHKITQKTSAKKFNNIYHNVRKDLERLKNNYKEMQNDYKETQNNYKEIKTDFKELQNYY